MSREGDEMLVNGAEGVDLASQSVVVVQPSSVAEPEDRLVAQSPPPPMPMSIAAGPSGSRVVRSLFCRCSTCTGMNKPSLWWTWRPVLWWIV